MHRIALLDDHQSAAARFADWSTLPEPAEVVAFADSVPLRELRRAVRTPHLGSVAERTYQVFWRDVVEEVAAGLRGTPVRQIS